MHTPLCKHRNRPVLGVIIQDASLNAMDPEPIKHPRKDKTSGLCRQTFPPCFGSEDDTNIRFSSWDIIMWRSCEIHHADNLFVLRYVVDVGGGSRIHSIAKAAMGWK